MARFIVDIGNYGQISEECVKEFNKRICDTFAEELCTSVCVDDTNIGAFYDGYSEGVNELTPEQIKKFKEISNPPKENNNEKTVIIIFV